MANASVLRCDGLSAPASRLFAPLPTRATITAQTRSVTSVQSTQWVFGRLNSAMRRIVALAGGVGGSRFARGLRAAAPDAELTIIVNTGDDVTLHGLRISPDVDTVLYALSGVVDEQRGWGPRGDSYRCMSALERLGGETWFRLGDLDLALHLRRTELLAAGLPPSAVTAQLAKHLGVHGV